MWINGATGPDPKDLIVFANGILNVPAFLDGDNDALLDPTPDLFTTAALPVAFDPTATCPSWLAFLQSSLGDDADKIKLLQEWIGYCLTPDTTYQKMLYMRGPTASGKGRILEVLSALVGPEQTCNTSFSDLSGSFGLAPLVGKLICTIGDARAPRDGTAMRGLELLLNIVGDDGLQINRKHKDQLESHRLTARITIASNEILDVPDNAGALIRRLNLLEFTTSFASNPDHGLPLRLRAEIPGIAVWALEGLRRLRSQGMFTVPHSSHEAILDWRTATSPVAAFLEECTDKVSSGEVHKQELYDVWYGWSSERRITPITVSRFFERVRSNATYVTSETYERGGHKHSVFKGIALKKWAAAKFGGRPEGRPARREAPPRRGAPGIQGGGGPMTSDKKDRKERPIASGRVLDYFPDAIAEVAERELRRATRQHNGDAPMHWDRTKSPDHPDCIARHLIERGTIDTDGLRHSAKVAWRALALLQTEIEATPECTLRDFIKIVEQVAKSERPTPAEPKDQEDYEELLRLGCPEQTAHQIVMGITYVDQAFTPISKAPYVYVAGPMRGSRSSTSTPLTEHAIRLCGAGFNVISPADIDRAANPQRITPRQRIRTIRHSLPSVISGRYSSSQSKVTRKAGSRC